MIALTPLMPLVEGFHSALAELTKDTYLEGSCCDTMRACGASVMTRVSAVAFAAILLITTIAYGALEWLGWNIELFMGRGCVPLACIKVNILFFKVILLSLFSSIGAIISPQCVYTWARMHETIQCCLRNMQIEQIPDFPEDMTRSLPDRGAALKKWRKELLYYFEDHPPKISGMIHPEDMKKALESIIRHHYRREQVIPPVEYPQDFFELIEDHARKLCTRIHELLVEYDIMNSVMNNLEKEQELRVIFYETLIQTHSELVRLRWYTSDDIDTRMDGSYHAMRDFTVLRLIQAVKTSDRALVWEYPVEEGHGDERLRISKISDVFGLYRKFAKIKNMIECLNQKEIGELQLLVSYKKEGSDDKKVHAVFRAIVDIGMQLEHETLADQKKHNIRWETAFTTR